MMTIQNAINNTGLIAPDANLCSGFGQFHTDKKDSPYRKDYLSVTLAKIISMAINPNSVAKESAQWFIPSTLKSREAALQRESGAYHATWCDFDEHTELERIKEVLAKLGCYHFIYASRSSKSDHQKWRVIIPLAIPANAADWQHIAAIINDKFQAVGIVPDRASERVNQICYLPNKGEFYQYVVGIDKPLLNWETVLQDELIHKKDLINKSQERQQAQRQQARLKAQERVITGGLSPIKAFGECYQIEQCFSWYGYQKRGNKWLSPNSESGVAGVTISGNKWFSKHTSDNDIGAASHDGGRFGDAFDLFIFFEHSGNRDAALKKAGEMFEIEGVSLTKKNQINHASRQGANNQPVDVDYDALLGESTKTLVEDNADFIKDTLAKLGGDIAAWDTLEFKTAMAKLFKEDRQEYRRVLDKLKAFKIKVDVEKAVKVFLKLQKNIKKATHPALPAESNTYNEKL